MSLRAAASRRPRAWHLATGLLAVLMVGCIELSPWQTDLDDDERDHTARNLERLMMADPPADGQLRFAVTSDSHQAFDELCELVDVLNERDDMAFVLHLGDMTDSGLRQEYRWTLDCLRSLEVPFFTAIGNHDALSNGAEVYRSMFGAYDYSFVYDEVRIVVLNTNPLEFQRPAPDPEWLAEMTAPSPSTRAVLVAAHQRPTLPVLEEALIDNDITALITAHHHHSRRGTLGDIPAITVGTAERLEWSLFTVTDGEVTFLECESRDCAEREP